MKLIATPSTLKVAEAIRDIHAYGEKAQSTIRKLKKATKSARFSSASGKLDELDGALSKCLGPIGKLLELYDKLHGLGDALGRLAAAIKWIAEMDINQNPKEAAIAFDTLFGAVGHTFMEVGKLLEQKDLRENAWKGDIALHQLAMEGLSMLFRAVGAFFLEADKNSFFEGMGAHLRDSAAERVKAEPGLKGLGIARGLE